MDEFLAGDGCRHLLLRQVAAVVIAAVSLPQPCCSSGVITTLL
jgi:hypothetical protein